MAELTTFRERFSDNSKQTYSKTTTFIKNRPVGSFVLVLLLLIVILIIGRFTQKQPEEKPAQAITKSVAVYSIGEGPKAVYQAKIEKSGVVTILAQSPGIVQNISVKEGDRVGRGQQIISLSTNYQGGNASGVQAAIAQKQYQNTLDTFDTQKGLIQDQRDVATASAENATKTREITRQSLGETNGMITNNQSQLDQINSTITTLQSNNTAGANDQQISQLQGSANQLQSALNQLRSAQRTADYQSSDQNAPATIANAQKDATLKQLDVQQKTLELNRDVSKLQAQLAYVNAALMSPASPFTGVVQNISVRRGQAVNAGTELATVAADAIETTAVLQVPQEVAKLLTTGEQSTLYINGKAITVTPLYIATEASSGQLYTIKYAVPEDQQKNVTDGQYVKIEVPLKMSDTSSSDPLIPIDAVYQTQDNAYVLVANKDKAQSKNIQLGEVLGNYVEVLSGLQNGDQVILDRNVISQDKIKINHK